MLVRILTRTDFRAGPSRRRRLWSVLSTCCEAGIAREHSYRLLSCCHPKYPSTQGRIVKFCWQRCRRGGYCVVSNLRVYWVRRIGLLRGFKHEGVQNSLAQLIKTRRRGAGSLTFPPARITAPFPVHALRCSTFGWLPLPAARYRCCSSLGGSR